MANIIKTLLENEQRGHAVFANNATKLKRRSVLEEVTKHSPSFSPLETKEHILETGAYVDVCHSINGTRFVVTIIDGDLVHGTMHKKHFEGAEIITRCEQAIDRQIDEMRGK